MAFFTATGAYNIFDIYDNMLYSTQAAFANLQWHPEIPLEVFKQNNTEYNKKKGTHNFGDRHQLQEEDIHPGCIVWLPKQTLCGTKAKIIATNQPAASGAYDHPVIVLSIDRSHEESTIVTFAMMSTFHGVSLETWLLQRQSSHGYRNSIPIFTNSSPRHLSASAQALTMAFGVDTGKQSYVKIGDENTFAISASALKTFNSKPTTRADTYRLDKSSYIRLMRILKLQPKPYKTSYGRHPGPSPLVLQQHQNQTLNPEARDFIFHGTANHVEHLGYNHIQQAHQRQMQRHLYSQPISCGFR